MMDALLSYGTVRELVERARVRGYAVRCVDLGGWGARIRPCAELDRALREIRFDTRLLTRALERIGARGAAELLCTALAHELAHLSEPGASEATVRARVRSAAARDPDALVREVLA